MKDSSSKRCPIGIRQRHPVPDERGAILLIALGFLLFAGTLFGALATLESPSFVTTTVVNNVQSAVAAADAGVKYGIQEVRESTVEQANPAICGSPSSSATLLKTPTIDGAVGDSGTGPQPPSTLRVSCFTSQGYAPGIFGYSVITNDTGSPPSDLGGDSITDVCSGVTNIDGDSDSDDSGSGGACNQTTEIDGPVYNSGGWCVTQPVSVVGGNTYTHLSDGQNTPCKVAGAPTVSIPPNTPYQQFWNVPQAIPTVPHVLPPVPATATASFVSHTCSGSHCDYGHGDGSGACNVFTPGTYTAANFNASHHTDINSLLNGGDGSSEDSSNNGNVYLESGVYYLDNLGMITIDQSTNLLAGYPAPGETNLTGSLPTGCGPDPNGWNTANGYGAEIILGGNTQLNISSQASVEIFTRVPAGAPATWTYTPGISIYQVPPACGSACTGYTATSLGQDTEFLIQGGTTSSEVFHGAIYGPSGSVNLISTIANQPVVDSGVDVWALNIASTVACARPPTPCSSVVVSTAAGLFPRTTVITATATLASGRPITARAVVEFNNDATNSAQIVAWNSSQ